MSSLFPAIYYRFYAAFPIKEPSEDPGKLSHAVAHAERAYCRLNRLNSLPTDEHRSERV